MSFYAIAAVTVIYLFVAVDNFRKKDYPHAGLWFCYSMANACMIWYEVVKNVPKIQP